MEEDKEGADDAARDEGRAEGGQTKGHKGREDDEEEELLPLSQRPSSAQGEGPRANEHQVGPQQEEEEEGDQGRGRAQQVERRAARQHCQVVGAVEREVPADAVEGVCQAVGASEGGVVHELWPWALLREG